jgi:hypothetical protein
MPLFIDDKSYLHFTLNVMHIKAKRRIEFDHWKLNLLCWKTILATRDESNVGKKKLRLCLPAYFGQITWFLRESGSERD